MANTLSSLGEPVPSEGVYELPPGPQYAPQLPELELALRNYYGNIPRISAGITLPTAAGDLQFRGSYQHDPYRGALPPDFSAMLGLRRRF